MIEFYTLPIFNPLTKTWLIDNKDGTWKEVSDEQYRNEYIRSVWFKTRYGAETGSTDGSKG